MESSTLLPLYQLSFIPSETHKRSKAAASPFSPWKKKKRTPTHINCGKMYVPGFGEASPEAKGAAHLHHFFTYVAVRIVQTQLEDYNPEANQELVEFLSRHSLNDGDKFCAELMRESPRHKGLAMRILEVRSAYCKRDFEWDNMQSLAFKMVDEANTRLMRDYVLETSHENEKEF